MEEATDESGHKAKQRTYVLVLRARSSVRFFPNEGFEVFFGNIPGAAGPVRIRLRTRWVDEGHEAAIPRELWIEARGPAPSLDDAVAKFGASGRFFSNLLALTANTSVDLPEVHVAYDASEGTKEREFLEVFLPDERGHPREGRMVQTRELTTVFEAINRFGVDIRRFDRAIQQYGLALRYWYFGGEWLALSHLYMAAETLADLVIADACKTRAIDKKTLASQLGVHVSDAESLEHKLKIWARRDVVFDGDNATYRDARYASDGIEHGFLELQEVNRHAQSVTAITFQYIRTTILRLLNVSQTEFPELYNRPPRDVGSLRKMIRGHFVGDGGDPAPRDQEYPQLEWNSRVNTAHWDGESFKVGFQERFAVRCAPGYQFRGLGMQFRVRPEPGADPIELSVVVDVPQEQDTVAASTTDELFALMKRTERLATATAAPSTSIGIPTLLLHVFNLFTEQIALFEAVKVLLRDNRPVEAMVLLRTLMLGSCSLESIANHPNREGVTIRVKLDALERDAKVSKSETQIVSRVRDQMASHLRIAAHKGITVPDVSPDIRETEFYTKARSHLNLSKRSQVEPISERCCMQSKMRREVYPSILKLQTHNCCQVLE